MATMEGEEEEEEKKEEQEDDYDEEEEEEEERRADKSWPLVNEHWLATVSGVLSLSFSSHSLFLFSQRIFISRTNE